MRRWQLLRTIQHGNELADDPLVSGGLRNASLTGLLVSQFPVEYLVEGVPRHLDPNVDVFGVPLLFLTYFATLLVAPLVFPF